MSFVEALQFFFSRLNKIYKMYTIVRYLYQIRSYWFPSPWPFFPREYLQTREKTILGLNVQTTAKSRQSTLSLGLINRHQMHQLELQCIAMVGELQAEDLKTIPGWNLCQIAQIGKTLELETRRNMFSPDFKLSLISMLPLEKRTCNSVLCGFFLREF